MSTTPLTRKVASRRGFSLVELLVSMLILGFMMAMIGAVLQGIANSTSLTQGHVTADAEAGLVFGRIGRDLAAMPNRNDIDSVFYKNTGTSATPGNDSMYFFAADSAPPVTGNPLSNIAIVGYQVVSPTDLTNLTGLGLQPYSLVRRVQALVLGQNSPTSTTPPAPTATNPSLPFFTYPNSTNFNNNSTAASPLSFVPNANSTIGGIWTGILPIPVPSASAATNTATNYHLLGEGVFRMEICYLLKQQTYPSATQPIIGGYSNIPTYSSAQLATYPAPSAAQAATLTSAAYVAQTPSSATSAFPQSRYYDTTSQRVYVCQANWDAAHSPTGAAQTIWTPAGMRDVSAVVVGLAVIDPIGRARITSTQLGSLAAALSDSDKTNTTTIPSVTSATASPPIDLMGYQWTQDLPGAISSANLPANFIRFVHIYQRTFYLNTSNLPYEISP